MGAVFNKQISVKANLRKTLMSANKGDIYLSMRELMNLMIILGYPSSPKGLCYGYAYSAQLAMLGEETDTFNQRSIKLSEIYRRLEEHTKESLLKIYNTYPPPNLNSDPDDYIGVLIAMLQKSRFAKDKTDFNKLERLKQDLVLEFTHSVQTIFINKESAVLQSQAYFDTVAVFHDISSIYPSNVPRITEQNARLVMGLLTPVNLEKKGKKIHHGNAITGIFDHRALSQALSAIAKKIPPMISPVSFEFAGEIHVNGYGDNPQHAIAVGFDPNKKEWLFADSMDHQIKRFPLGKEDELAAEILKEFTQGKKFEGWIAKPLYINPLLTDAKALQPFNQGMTELQSSEVWLQLQASNPESEEFLVKSILAEGSPQDIENFFSRNPYKLLITKIEIDKKPLINWFIWARNSSEDIDALLASFIKCGGVVNTTNSEGEFAFHLYLADCWKRKLTEGDKKAIQLFLDNGADINARTSGNHSPLFHSVYHCNNELVYFLLEKGADPNQLSVNWDDSIISPLHLAIETIGRGEDIGAEGMEVAIFLIEHGADPHAGEELGKGKSAFQLLQDEREKYPGFEAYKQLEELFLSAAKTPSQSGGLK